MNISVLTDANPKTYLNINCNDLNCNDVNCNDIVCNELEATEIKLDVLDVNTVNCTSLVANTANVANININGNYSLPTTVPTNGQLISVSGGNTTWINSFNGFQAQYVGAGLALPVANTSICNTLLLGTNYDTGTFTYTVPVTGIYQLGHTVNWQWTSTVNPASGRVDSAFKVIDGATTYPGYIVGQTYATTGTAQTHWGINSIQIYKQLNSGTQVQLTISNISSANTPTIMNAFLSAKLMQAT